MWDGPASATSRRTLLLGGAAGLLTLGGCGIRLEDDAPRIPLLPTRTPLPAEDLLVALARECAVLAARAEGSASPLARTLGPLHRRQHTVLRTALVGAGVRAEVLDSPEPSATPAPTSTTTPPPSPALGATEAASAARAAQFAAVAGDLRAPVAALHAQRWAAATVLTGRAPSAPAAGAEPVGGRAVGDLADATASAVYLLEVATARSTGAQRTRGTATLTALRGVLAEQRASGDAPEPSLGHPLPFPVATPADAVRLARAALTGLRTDHGRALADLAALGAPGLVAATRWQGTIEAEASRWGAALTPFPGLA